MKFPEPDYAENFLDTRQLETAAAHEHQEERRREVDLKRLGGNLSHAIFRERREESWIADQSTPLNGEISYRDYRVRRDAGEQ
jgi:hypothetical protein